MIGGIRYRLRFDKAEMIRDFQGDAEYLISVYMKSITELSKRISILHEEITREVDEGGFSRRKEKSSILTPSLMQKRRLLKPPQEYCGFAPFDCVIPALLMAPRTRISTADLVFMVKAGDLNGLDELFRTGQANPLDILDQGSFRQVSYKVPGCII
jgi:uncharacterized small protein (DUF1192 family)